MSISRETLYSLFLKLAGITATFVSVSLLVRHLGRESYGAWATLASTFIWIQMSDLGLGAVVRNRIATRRSDQPVCEDVAAALTLTSAVAATLIVFYAGLWRHISIARDYPFESALMYVTALIMLPCNVGVNILQGLGLTRVTFLASLVQMTLWLALIVVLGMHPSITALAVGFSVLWAGVCIYQLARALDEMQLLHRRFLFQLVDLAVLRKLRIMLPVGGTFFLLQLTSLILFNLGTYLSYTIFSAEAAAKYDVLSKIFQIPLTLFNVIITVAWSRIAREASDGNFEALERIQNGLLTIAVGGSLLMFAFAALAVRRFVDVYSHGQVAVSMHEVMAFTTQTAIQMVAYAAAVFMNAVERLRIQMVFATASAALFVPVFHALRMAGLNVVAVPLSTAIVLLPSALYFTAYVRGRIITPLRTIGSSGIR